MGISPAGSYRSVAREPRRRQCRDDVEDDCLADPRWRLHRLHHAVDDGPGRTADGVVAEPDRDVVARISEFRAVCGFRRAPADPRDRNLGLRAVTIPCAVTLVTLTRGSEIT